MIKAIEKIGVLAAAATALLLILAVAHEYGYFYVVGSHFQALLTVSDYLANALLWLPWGTLIAYTWIDWRHANNDPFRSFNIRDWRSWALPTILGASWLAAILFSSSLWWPSFLTFVDALYVWWWFWGKKEKSTDDEISDWLVRFIKYGVPILGAMIVWGIVNGETDLITTSDPYIIRIDGADSDELRIIMRTLDRGLLTRNARNDRVEFIQWDDLKFLSKPIPSTRRSFACRLFGWTCKPADSRQR